MIIAILILTILDVLLTSAGIELGVITEANPILQNIFHISPSIASAIIIIFVACLLLIMYKYQNKLYWINSALVMLIIVKIGVLGLHLRWILTIV